MPLIILHIKSLFIWRNDFERLHRARQDIITLQNPHALLTGQATQSSGALAIITAAKAGPKGPTNATVAKVKELTPCRSTLDALYCPLIVFCR